MTGLYFSIIGLIFGSLCSYKAKKNEYCTKNWFLVGFVLGPLGLIIINLRQTFNRNLKTNESSILSMNRI